MKICPNCQAQNQDSQAFCFQCGTHLPVVRNCAQCQTPLPAGAAFCGNCGLPVQASAPGPQLGGMQPPPSPQGYGQGGYGQGGYAQGGYAQGGFGQPGYGMASSSATPPLPRMGFFELGWHELTARYLDFSGRSSVRGYWSMMVVFWLIVIALIVALVIVGGMGRMMDSDSAGPAAAILGIAMILGYLASIIPTLAVGVRRLHDLGKSGWLLLLSFIPLVGGIILLVWFCTGGEKMRNQYGEVPQ